MGQKNTCGLFLVMFSVCREVKVFIQGRGFLKLFVFAFFKQRKPIHSSCIIFNPQLWGGGGEKTETWSPDAPAPPRSGDVGVGPEPESSGSVKSSQAWVLSQASDRPSGLQFLCLNRPLSQSYAPTNTRLKGKNLQVMEGTPLLRSGAALRGERSPSLVALVKI